MHSTCKHEILLLCADRLACALTLDDGASPRDSVGGEKREFWLFDYCDQLLQVDDTASGLSTVEVASSSTLFQLLSSGSKLAAAKWAVRVG